MYVNGRVARRDVFPDIAVDQHCRPPCLISTADDLGLFLILCDADTCFSLEGMASAMRFEGRGSSRDRTVTECAIFRSVEEAQYIEQSLAETNILCLQSPSGLEAYCSCPCSDLMVTCVARLTRLPAPGRLA